MLIQTNADAVNALEQLNTDLQATAQLIAASAIQVDTQNNMPFGAGIAASIYNSGAQDLNARAANLILGLEQDVLTELGEFDGSSNPISDQQKTDLQNLQQAVIQGRAAVNSTISAVDWTFGDLAGDAITTVQNTASQIVGGAKDALKPLIPSINWTAVELGLAGLAVVLVYALFLRVRG